MHDHDDARESPIRLIVLDRGFVFVGRCPDPAGCGLWITVEDARCVRVWGTSNGLGELCSGPTSNTVLDDLVPSMTFAVRALLFTFNDVNQAAWTPHLKPSGAEQTHPSGGRSRRIGSRSAATT